MAKLVSALIVTVLAAACGPAAGPAASPSTAASAVSTASPAPATIKFGQVGTISDSAIFIADAKGFFKEQGITLELQTFQSAANMVAPLGTGELDAGGGAPSAGLYNAIDRGVKMRIVADKGSLTAGHGYEAVLVRKALAEKVKSARDMKGLKVSIAARDIVPEYSLDAFLRTGGLTVKDVEVVPLAFPDMAPAMANGSIDVAVPTEPTATRILDAGTAVLITRTDAIVPGEQTAVILFSEKLAQQKDVAVRFMKAYLQGARFYTDAFEKKDPAKRKEAIDILAKATKLDAALIERIVLPWIDPNGAVNAKSLDAAQQYFVAKGTQQKALDMSTVVDTSFADEAVRQLGQYR
ncbi:MAG TPA: ABC transporter substrate-binding protein [Candidatus Limnocylindria bacterium]|jgi:NitT/TauT family transport system substrate-binding protein|nr:ABC transporter substrate-binding protein [Candidatus Limnocylindria bacterium]